MSLRLITSLQSPNHGEREPGTVIDMLVLHYTGMKTGEDAVARLCDSAAEVSAHYVVFEDGRVLRLVPESRRAWHAGVASWRGHSDINNRSIGVEIVNPGHEFGYVPFPAAQMQAVEAVCRQILGRHPTIPARNVVGHSDVAPWRKEDPGELFDWPGLGRAGIGVFPGPEAIASASTEGDATELLTRIGYRIDAEVSSLTHAVRAFQRHFHPADLSGRADAATIQRMHAVLGLCDVA